MSSEIAVENSSYLRSRTLSRRHSIYTLAFMSLLRYLAGQIPDLPGESMPQGSSASLMVLFNFPMAELFQLYVPEI